MAIIPADFKARYPEFSSVDDARVQTMLDEAVLEVGAGPWGPFYEKGVFLLTAHFLVIDARRQSAGGGAGGGGTEGQVTSRKVGDVSVTFGAQQTTSTGSDQWYLSTSYGAEYLRLKKRKGIGIVAVGAYSG